MSEEDSSAGIKKLAEIMKKREFCNKECKYFDTCPLQPISCDPENEDNGKFKCLLKTKGVDYQRTYLNLFLEGRVGIANELLVSLLKLKESMDCENKNDIKAYLEMVMKVNKEVYGTAKQVEVNDELEVKISEVSKKTPICEIRGKDNKMTKQSEYEIPYSQDEESLLNDDYMVEYIEGSKRNKKEE